jgi:phosphoribosylformylglycinamidine synthase
VIETENVPVENFKYYNKKFHFAIGKTNNSNFITYNSINYAFDELIEKFEKPLRKVYPEKAVFSENNIKPYLYAGEAFRKRKSAGSVGAPNVFIPVFPGTNCEYDTARRFEKAGAKTNVFVFKNLTANDVSDSIEAFVKNIKNAQIVMIPGGFSGGDEPDGSGKFISAVFRNERIKEEINKLLYVRDGLMLGICNGFQALIKLGLVPFGEISEPKADWPTLTFNTITRHISTMVNIKVVSGLSPWLSACKPGNVYKTAISHGEGRFTAPENVLDELVKNGQIATQYTDLNGGPAYDAEYNPNGSLFAVEGITSKCGRIFGKMGHSERIGENLYKNIYGDFDMKLFESGVGYFG